MKIIDKMKSLFNHQGFKKYFANTSWLFAEKILRMVVGLFVGIWVARYLGPDKFGLLSYAQSFVGLFSAIATLGLNGILVRELVRYPEKENELLGTAFILKLLGAFLILLILYIAINFTSNDTYTNILIFIIASATIFQAFNVIDFYFQAKVMSKYVVFANSFSLLLSSFIKILLIINEAPLIDFAVMVVFDSLVMGMGYVYWYFKVKKEFFLRKIKFQFDIAKKLLKDSWPLIIADIGYILYRNIDQVMLFNFFHNSAMIGLYKVSITFINLFIGIVFIVINSVYPLIIQLYNKQNYIFIIRLYNIISIISIFFIIFITLIGKKIFLILYGNEYIGALPYLIPLSLIFYFESIAYLSGRLVWIKNLQKYTMWRTIIGMILNIILNYILIPLYDIKGAIYATLITMCFTDVIFFVFFKRTREIFLFQFNFFMKENNKNV